MPSANGTGARSAGSSRGFLLGSRIVIGAVGRVLSLVSQLLEQVPRDALEDLAVVGAHLLLPDRDPLLLGRLGGKRVGTQPLLAGPGGPVVGLGHVARHLLEPL